MTAIERRETTYVMGYTDEERQRLMYQAATLEDSTRRLFFEAGIGPGMRVLDVGCGVGDVSFLASSLVGDDGAVVGLDDDPRALALARQRATDRGLPNVEFVAGNLREFAADRPFDAVVGRLILMYLGDPADALRQLARNVRPGGIVAFQEIQLDFVPMSSLPVPMLDQVLGWALPTFRRAGAETAMGLKLYDAFVGAGLPAPQLHMDVFFVSPTDDRWIHILGQTLRSILPLMERFGVATAEEVEVETWVQRHRDEVVTTGAVHTNPPMVRAWTRTREA